MPAAAHSTTIHRAWPNQAATTVRRESPRVTAPPGRPGLSPGIRRLAQAIAEVLAGARPVGQLEDAVSLEVLRVLGRAAGRLGRTADGPTRRPIVGSVHVDSPSPGIVEAAVVIDTGVRVQAIALRLEAAAGRWRCSDLALG